MRRSTAKWHAESSSLSVGWPIMALLMLLQSWETMTTSWGFVASRGVEMGVEMNCCCCTAAEHSIAVPAVSLRAVLLWQARMRQAGGLC
jgi:hypothetical protein